MIDNHHGWNASTKPLFIGFVLSIVLIFAAYRCVAHYHLSHYELALTVVILGTMQAILQLIFFLHLGLESKPRWNLLMFLFMILVTIILIGGSLWIMDNISKNSMQMMTS